MPFKMKSPLPLAEEKKDEKKKSNKKKAEQKTPRQKFIDKGIRDGTLPAPDTMEKLMEYREAYFDERFV